MQGIARLHALMDRIIRDERVEGIMERDIHWSVVQAAHAARELERIEAAEDERYAREGLKAPRRGRIWPTR